MLARNQTLLPLPVSADRQFFYRATDADVQKYLSVLTLVPPAQIEATMREHEADPKKRVAQQLLAEEVTELVHGRECGFPWCGAGRRWRVARGGRAAGR